MFTRDESNILEIKLLYCLYFFLFPETLISLLGVGDEKRLRIRLGDLEYLYDLNERSFLVIKFIALFIFSWDFSITLFIVYA